MTPKWKPGDKVEVYLPDYNARPRRRAGAPAMTWVRGVVTEVDPPDNIPGVTVTIARMVNGANSCFAAHGELRAVDDW
jgi:hypothetical protein